MEETHSHHSNCSPPFQSAPASPTASCCAVSSACGRSLAFISILVFSSPVTYQTLPGVLNALLKRLLTCLAFQGMCTVSGTRHVRSRFMALLLKLGLHPTLPLSFALLPSHAAPLFALLQRNPTLTMDAEPASPKLSRTWHYARRTQPRYCPVYSTRRNHLGAVQPRQRCVVQKQRKRKRPRQRRRDHSPEWRPLGQTVSV